MPNISCVGTESLEGCRFGTSRVAELGSTKGAADSSAVYRQPATLPHQRCFKVGHGSAALLRSLATRTHRHRPRSGRGFPPALSRSGYLDGGQPRSVRVLVRALSGDVLALWTPLVITEEELPRVVDTLDPDAHVAGELTT